MLSSKGPRKETQCHSDIQICNSDSNMLSNIFNSTNKKNLNYNVWRCRMKIHVDEHHWSMNREGQFEKIYLVCCPGLDLPLRFPLLFLPTPRRFSILFLVPSTIAPTPPCRQIKIDLLLHTSPGCSPRCPVRTAARDPDDLRRFRLAISLLAPHLARSTHLTYGRDAKIWQKRVLLGFVRPPAPDARHEE